MTTLIVAGTKDEAASLRGRPDSVVLTLRQLTMGSARGRSFGVVEWTADANARATDLHRDEVVPCLLASSGRP